MARSSCKSGVLQHPINISHIIIFKKLQKIKMRTRTTNQSEKNTKKTLNPAEKTG
jgi:carbonic anhydrase